MSATSLPTAASATPGEETPPLAVRLAARGLDGTTLLVLPALLAILGLFVYPFAYGLVLSLQPKAGAWWANYARFFSDPFLYDTIAATLRLALPVTVLNLVLAVPIALRVRLMRHQRLLTTILVLPITLAVSKGLTVDDLAQTFSIYPSLSGSITEAGRRLMNSDDE